ncbi:MAG: T9SS type A sorting domain-containing protein [Bacteroidia bacterium]|nr:T9SS type A sorting domain-containing protein [Bacteroidia bacterium]
MSKAQPVVMAVGENAGNDQVQDIAFDASGNRYVVGKFIGVNVDFDPGSSLLALSTPNTLSDAFVAKYSSGGALVWAFSFGSTGTDFAYGITVSGNDVYVIGNINGTVAVDMDPSSGTNSITGQGSDEIVVAKYDGSLTPTSTSFYQWAFNIGSSNLEYAYGIALSGTNLYVAGGIFGTGGIDVDPSSNTNTLTGAGSYDIFVVKYDVSVSPSSASFYQWSFLAGTSLSEVAMNLIISGSSMYLTGYIEGTSVDMDPSSNTNSISSGGNHDIFVARYDISVDPSSTSFYKWAFRAGGSQYDYGYGLAVSGTDVYVSGVIFGTTAIDMDPSSNTNNITGAGNNDGFVAKYDGSLTPSSTSFYKWAFRFGGTGSNDDISYDMTNSGSDIYITGRISGTTAIDMDPSTGTYSVTGAGGYDVIAAKYDGSLTPSNTSFCKWAFRVGGTGSEVGYGINISGTDLVVAGIYAGNAVDFDPGAGTSLAYAGAATANAFISSYSSSTPSFSNLVTIGNKGGSCAARGIATDASGNVYVTGSIDGSNDIDPGGGTFYLHSAGGSDAYVAKYSNTGSLVWAFSFGGTAAESGYKLALSGTDIYLIGYTASATSFDIDPASGTTNLSSAGSNDLILAKLDGTLTPSDNGFLKWAFTLGGAGLDHLFGISVSGSNVYVTGLTGSTSIDVDPSSNTNSIGGTNNEIIVMKYDGSLTPSNTSFYQWGFSIGGSSNDQANDIVVSGSYMYITGIINGTTAIDADPSSNTNSVTGAGGSDVFVAKYDISVTPSSTSFYQWAFVLGTSSSENGFGISVSGNDVYISGSSGAMDMDPSSNTNNITNAGSLDGFVAKYNGSFSPSSTSFYQWAFSFGGSGGDAVNDISVQGSNVYIAGYIQNTSAIDMDPSSNSNTVTGSGNNDVLVAAYDGSLTPSSTSFYKWAFAMGGVNGDLANVIETSSSKVYIGGYYSAGTIDFDPSPSSTLNYTSFATTSFAAVYPSSNPLPVEWLTFTAHWLAIGESAQLNWSTASETNNSHFTILRSTDGQVWEELDQIAGAGNTATVIRYTYIDHTLQSVASNGTIYYRIMQTDFDGKFSLSDINVLKSTKEQVVSVSPNPGSLQMIKLKQAATVDLPYTIFDMHGREVGCGVIDKGQMQQPISLQGLPSGVYFLKIGEGLPQEVIKLLSQ